MREPRELTRKLDQPVENEFAAPAARRDVVGHGAAGSAAGQVEIDPFAVFLSFLACRFSLAVLVAGVLLARPPLSLPAMMAFPQPGRNAGQRPLSHRSQL